MSASDTDDRVQDDAVSPEKGMTSRATSYHAPWLRHPHASHERDSLPAIVRRAPTHFVAVLVTDISHVFPQRHVLTQDEHRTVLEWHDAAVRRRVRHFGGHVSKFMGDGFEVLFTTPGAALRCAASCQRALSRRNGRVAPPYQVRVRMGITCGEVPASKGRVYGWQLVLAHRLAEIAEDGQVLVPAHLRDAVAGFPFRFTAVGARTLRNSEAPIAVSAFHWWDFSKQGRVPPRSAH
jgi:class 3 adenylate cyclase